MSTDQQTYQRASATSLLGLGVQFAVAVVLLLMYFWSGHPATLAATYHAAGGLLLWFCLWLIFQQHKLERAEALEAERLGQLHGEESSIFETTVDDLSVARRRLAALYRWVLPATGLLTSGYLLGVGIWLFRAHQEVLGQAAGVNKPGLALAISAGLALVGFLISRYIAGMAQHEPWQLLRGGASYLMGVVLVNAVLVVAFALDYMDLRQTLNYMGVIVPAAMAAIGAEMAMNLVLGIYRPRKPGEVPRPAFDSRLLSLLTTPESIAKTINEAINYQFGFEITRSWFWQLLSRVFGGLVIFGLVVLLAVSCLVVVDAGERALVIRSGKKPRSVLDPGLHWKAPWPISTVRRYELSRTRRVSIGSAATTDGPLLWAETKAKQKRPLLVGQPEARLAKVRGGSGEGVSKAEFSAAPPVSLAYAKIDVLYHLRDGGVLQYASSAENPRALVRAVGERVVSRRLVQASFDQWTGSMRSDAEAEMRKSIARACKRFGVKIQAVIFSRIRPPGEVATAFEKVNAARQKKRRAIQQAKREAIRIVAETVGSRKKAQAILSQRKRLEWMTAARENDRSAAKVEQRIAELKKDLRGWRKALEGLAADSAKAEELKQKIAEAERKKRKQKWALKAKKDATAVQRQRKRLDDMLLEAGGRAAKQIAKARGDRWRSVNERAAQAARFKAQLAAYRKLPRVFKWQKYLDVLERTMQWPRKFLIVGDHGDLTIRGDFTETSGAFGNLDFLSAQRKKRNTTNR